MIKIFFTRGFLVFFLTFSYSQLVWAEKPTVLQAASTTTATVANQPAAGANLFPVGVPRRPLVTPPPPNIDAKAYILLDSDSGVVLAAKTPDSRLAPASLTKIMTSYIISAAVKANRVHLEDPVTISEKAWRMGGSKTFIKVGSTVPGKDLVQGIIVQSGNDACVAMAEHIAGGEDAFVDLMNQQAAILGMKNTHFTDSTGMPNPNHYTTPRDMGTLARALIRDFPEEYKWYSQKWFLYNNIRQPNRNRLLWRDPSVDGIKTGHTDDAGFCLVASAKRNNMRLISVVMGAPSDNARTEDSQELLNYGFRFFETHPLYNVGAPIDYARVWFGKNKKIPVGPFHGLTITVPVGQFGNIRTEKSFDMNLKAPVEKGQAIGTISVFLNDKLLLKEPLYALQADPKAGFFSQIAEYVRLGLYRLLGAGGPAS
jgi:serine-type D-Ala-D-Ala carboxypeptidase (penicillin-binding protein 5/6)